ncbi:hypothetical protein Tco_0456571, partial [Tanacetum coccineum]
AHKQIRMEIHAVKFHYLRDMKVYKEWYCSRFIMDGGYFLINKVVERFIRREKKDVHYCYNLLIHPFYRRNTRHIRLHHICAKNIENKPEVSACEINGNRKLVKSAMIKDHAFAEIKIHHLDEQRANISHFIMLDDM